MAQLSTAVSARLPHWLVDRAVNAVGEVRPMLFISGFWRSGTTWLQESLAAALQAKTVFEPLSPGFAPWRTRLVRSGCTQRTLQEALIPGPAPRGSSFWVHLDRAISGAASLPASTRARRTLAESLSRRVIVKDVRMHFNLDGVHARYGVPVLHLRRHPCAVVSSLLQAPSNNWSLDFAQLSLRHLAAQRLFPAALTSFDGRLSDYDQDPISRIACYWALTERWVHAEFDGKAWFKRVAYEDALQDPARVRGDVCRWAGLSLADPALEDVDSSTTYRSARALSPLSRASAWRNLLTPGEIGRVMDITARLFPGYFEDGSRDA